MAFDPDILGRQKIKKIFDLHGLFFSKQVWRRKLLYHHSIQMTR